MQFQETGPDQVLDIEQSETTKWLQHTGWPQLFRNRPLDIIAASTLQPGPACNEDYLLGSWQGTQVWSSVAVEAQLQIILRGVQTCVYRYPPKFWPLYRYPDKWEKLSGYRYIQVDIHTAT
ncbi:hypothetical protein EDB80DRAFT_254496 [Ilyonectria destructans]|nr:hypothetical protein EDB80DRAFT_254496 [Ilyonectria destructans]